MDEEETLSPQPGPGRHSSPLIAGPASCSCLFPTTPVPGDGKSFEGCKNKEWTGSLAPHSSFSSKEDLGPGPATSLVLSRVTGEEAFQQSP